MTSSQVLFPLLTKLLENISPADPDGMEETRMRGATLLSKVSVEEILIMTCCNRGCRIELELELAQLELELVKQKFLKA